MIRTALLGNPVDHSPSPLMYAEYAAAVGLPAYEHVRLRMSGDVDELRGVVRALFRDGYVGLNITLPLKLHAVRVVDQLDPTAASCGAVNVIVSSKGRLLGANTDVEGARYGLQRLLGRPCSGSDIVVVLGSGGAARAIVAAAEPDGATVRIVHRTPASHRTLSLLEDFPRVAAYPFDRLEQALRGASVACNATPVGMTGDECPVEVTLLARALAENATTLRGVFDVVIRGAHTSFLRCGRGQALATGDGITMMVAQGVEAFSLWTGLRPPPPAIERAERRVREVTR